MSAFVINQVPLCREPLATVVKGTLVRLLSSMNAEMSFQISLFRKPFGTIGTLERFLSRVSPVVNVETRLLAVALIAAREPTGEGLVLVMDFKVRIALAFCQK